MGLINILTGNIKTVSVDIKTPVVPPVNPPTDTSTPISTPSYELKTTDEGKVLILPSKYNTITEKKGLMSVKIDKSASSLVNSVTANILSINITPSKTATGMEIIIPKEIMESILKKDMMLFITFGDVTFKIDVTKSGELYASILSTEAIDAPESYTTTDMNYDFVIKLDGKIVNNEDNTIKIVLSADDLKVDLDKAAIYTLDASKILEYVMTYLRGTKLEFYPPHFSEFSVMVCPKTFDDVKNHWAKDFIEDMASKNVVNGKDKNLFAPDDIITRAEFVTMVVRALGLKGTGTSTFDNVSKNTWYANYLSLAKDAGLIEGKNYNAEGIISRIEMAKIISIAHSILNGTKVKFEGKSPFTDIESTNPDLTYIGYAVDKGLITGYPDKSFRPVEDTSRAEAMTVIYKLLNVK